MENHELNHENEMIFDNYFQNPNFPSEINIHPPNYNDQLPLLTTNYSYRTWDNPCYYTIDQQTMSNIMLTSSSSSSQLLIPHENTNNSNPINSTHEYDQTTPYNNPNVDQTITNDPNLAPKIIDFSSWAEENRRSTDDTSEHRSIKRKRVCTSGNRTEVQAQDHLVAEKKRRENLRQLFIGLSKVVPGIKKLDKASLLEDAINHLKSLQERVRVLEEEQIKNGSNATAQLSSAPEIKVRIWNKQVLIKICCENRTGIMSKIPCEIEKINFNVMDMRFMVFGGATLYIIILAEMQSEFGAKEEDIVGQLRTVLLNKVG